ncbi:MAG: glycosyltransferase family 9 protein [Bdellovibrionota bacterium]|nr:glycosyltransferase family 9 protein [Bdellovibrionota bacterium]
MEKILIVNLKRLGDIFQTAHLVNSIKRDNPSKKVHLLCYEESVKAAKIINGLDEVHTINRKKVVSYFRNSIYSDGLAFNELNEALNKVVAQGFDKVLNYSNDRVSTYLTSYISNTLKCDALGVRFTPKQTVEYSNDFALVLNDIVTQTSFTPYSFNDCAHKIAGVEIKNERSTIIKSNKIHDKTAINNLDRLRSLKSQDANRVSIIGIQVSSASIVKEIPEDTLIETIRLINSSETMIPILLTAPTEEEKKKASRINKEFENKLVSVEADFIALPSVLKNIDLLLTPDTSIKHLADLLDTPVLEVSLGHAPMFKQGTINLRSAILSEAGHTRIFKENGEAQESVLRRNSSLSPNLIFNTINTLLGNPEEILNIPNQNTYCIYRPIQTTDGILLMPEAGPTSSSFECKRIVSRLVTQKIMTGTIDEDLITTAYSYITKKEFQNTIESEKMALSEVTKDLLSTLRGLIQTQENKSKAPAFIEALERLLARCFDNNIAAIPTLIFRAKVDSLASSSLEDNFKEVETHLYQLKDSLQSCLYVFKRIEDIGYGIGRTKTESSPMTKEKTL